MTQEKRQCCGSQGRGTWSGLRNCGGLAEAVLFKPKPEGWVGVSGFGAGGNRGPGVFPRPEAGGRAGRRVEWRAGAVVGGDAGEAGGAGPAGPCRSCAALSDSGC